MGHTYTCAASAITVLLFFTCVLPVILNVTSSNKNICWKIFSQLYHTNCRRCDLGPPVICQNDTFLDLYTSSCEPKTEFERLSGEPFCLYTCYYNMSMPVCCDGSWGEKCDDCPGGSDSPCLGHGTCEDGLGGTGVCTCEPGFTGYACEMCVDTNKYGPNCTQDCQCERGVCYNTVDSDGCICDLGYTGSFCNISVEYPECANVTCPDNTTCVVAHNVTLCICGDAMTSNSSSCYETDPCQEEPSCDPNAICTPTQNTTFGKNCTCSPDYHGDGYLCDPVDPCQTDNAGCPNSTTTCVYTGPGKSVCECLEGYHEYVNSQGCSMIDMCAVNSSACHKYAVCKMDAPLHMTCECQEGYIGDGLTCSGNIVKTIEELHTEDPTLKGQLGFFKRLIEKFYNTELSNHGPFTLFAPTDVGFRTMDTKGFDDWMNNEAVVRHVLRQHILVGRFPLEKMSNESLFYTLQGNSAEMQSKRNGLFRYRVEGSNRKIKILRPDVRTANGIIHITNTFLVDSPTSQSESQVLLSEIVEHKDYSRRLHGLISACGDEIRSLIDGDSITLFAPTNSAFDKLPIGAMDYLTSPEGHAKCVALLKNHLFNRTIEIAELINLKTVTSLANTVIPISITSKGRVQLNKMINITYTDLAGRNGLLMVIDGVLQIPGASVLPNRCDEQTTKLVKGPCSDVRDETYCFKPDVATNLTVDCVYFLNHGIQPRTGWANMCNRTSALVKKCCPEFYGEDCLPCPGGHANPCTGHGTCDDGIQGSGTCTCQENIAGDLCNQCNRPDYFGPNCTQKCTCLKGECDNGPGGLGQCKPHTCALYYQGLDCDKQLHPCSYSHDTFCHANALCLKNPDFSFMCVCLPYYKGDGITDCQPVDPCSESPNGGCHLQATCKMTSAGHRSCTCNSGWTGDGLFCYPGLWCSNHADCDKNALCEETIPGEHICRCVAGYHGNGTQCLKIDMCEEDNGGCDKRRASCATPAPGQVLCTCNNDLGYSGNGIHCYGDLITEIKDHPRLVWLQHFLEKAPDYELQLLRSYNYTIFAPNDDQLMKFMATTDNIYWQTTDNIATLLNFHTLYNSSSINTLLQLGYVKDKFDTLEDGFSLHVFRDGDSVKVSARKNGSLQATVLEADIIATNGYIHIIDQVLEPFLPPDEDSLPDLSDFFLNHTEFSLFGDWLKEKGLLDYMEDNLTDYTLFVPSNTAMLNLNRTVTKDFLRFYLIPQIKLLASIDFDEKLETDLGREHQLRFEVGYDSEMYVNGVKVIQQDILTAGGSVNIIADILHPVLSFCVENIDDFVYGPCLPCGVFNYTCPDQYTPRPVEEMVSGCDYTYALIYLYTQKGCSGLCDGKKEIPGCCAGHYGDNCAECPSGPEEPCSGNGVCDDGIHGTGKCNCTEHSYGDMCELCTPGWTGIHCDIDMGTCAYLNGNCSFNARCIQGVNNSISCVCKPGYRGNGTYCEGPCDIDNGGCKENAICKYAVAKAVSCSCRPGYVGDGINVCNGDIYNTLETIPSASQFLKSLQSVGEMLIGESLTTKIKKQNFTVFVPVDSSLHNTLMSLDDIKDQLVPSTSELRGLKLGINSPSNQTVTTLSGTTLLIQFDSATKQYYVNGSKVLTANIVYFNGFVHLMTRPFRVSLKTLHTQGAPNQVSAVAIVIPVVLVIVGVLVTLGVIVYRRSVTGYWNLMSAWLAKRQGEDLSSAAPLEFQADENLETEVQNPSRSSTASTSDNSINFGNPLYNSKE